MSSVTGAGPPLIVTALLDEAAQQRFDRLRRSHFPPERNHLDAHLTLFHRLPDASAVVSTLAVAADQPTITARVRRVRGWRGGVAYDLAAPELTALRGRLAQCWSDPAVGPGSVEVRLARHGAEQGRPRGRRALAR
jgi:hypothetical protein